jgi:nicotinamide-nucleotide adenylyltransferase
VRTASPTETRGSLLCARDSSCQEELPLRGTASVRRSCVGHVGSYAPFCTAQSLRDDLDGELDTTEARRISLALTRLSCLSSHYVLVYVKVMLRSMMSRSMSASHERTSHLLNRVQTGLSSIELVYTPHPSWPLSHHNSPSSSTHLRISVLDSSFNPPTLAHLALAKSQPAQGSYDARLLLLSIRNADKLLKPTDANLLQRLEMMAISTQDIDSDMPDSMRNAATAIIDEPTFVGKSRNLLTFLRDHIASLDKGSLASPPKIQLTFLQGFDTLERLFSPRYYASHSSMTTLLRGFFSPDHDDSTLVCAWRGDESKDVSVLPSLAKEFIDAGRIVLIDIGEKERQISSTEIRGKRARSDEGWKQFLTPRIARYVEEQKLYL